MFNKEKLELKHVPMMPVREMVIFPEMMHPFIVGREASVRALEEALAGDKKIDREFLGAMGRLQSGQRKTRTDVIASHTTGTDRIPGFAQRCHH